MHKTSVNKIKGMFSHRHPLLEKHTPFTSALKIMRISSTQNATTFCVEENVKTILESVTSTPVAMNHQFLIKPTACGFTDAE